MNEHTITLFYLTEKLPIMLKADALVILFAAVTILVWILCGIYAIGYFKGEKKRKRFWLFYILAFIVILCLDFSGNIITFYFFYELMTLMSVPLVFHMETKEAIMAGLKYLFYSLCGAYFVLYGFYFVFQYADTLTFTPGGVFSMEIASGQNSILLVAAFCMLFGFSVKAGMFPMQSWLWTAHPAAPAPASAFLSGIIVKSGVLGMIRTIYYLFGSEMLLGTWVQIVILTLTLITVFMGSLLAYREKWMKKRLAYSTISQISYIVFGLLLFQPAAFIGALLHVVYHAVNKSCLFLSAGSVIHETGKEKAEEWVGIGKQMPLTLWCFTFASLSLVGIPPAAGFISKWNLCIGALDSQVLVFSIVGPVILLISALLTAGYLLSITVRGFLPGRDFEMKEKVHTSAVMIIPVAILGFLSIWMGLFPGQLIEYIGQIVSVLI